MGRTTFSISMSAALAIVSVTGCLATDVGNPQDSKVTVDFELTSSLRDATIEEAWWSVDEIELVGDSSGCTERDVVTVSKPAAVSFLARGEATGESLYLDAPSGSYCTFTLLLAPNEAATARQPALAGLSYYVRGRLADGTPFEITDSRPLRLDFSRPGSFGLVADLERFFVTFDANTVLADELLEDADEKDGVLEISEACNTGLWSKLDARVADSVSISLDANRNGTLDESESEVFELDGEDDDDDDDEDDEEEESGSSSTSVSLSATSD